LFFGNVANRHFLPAQKHVPNKRKHQFINRHKLFETKKGRENFQSTFLNAENDHTEYLKTNFYDFYHDHKKSI